MSEIIYGSEVIVVPVIFAMPTVLILAKMWLGFRERQAARKALPHDVAAVIEARLERLEGAVDAVAVEIERLGEGQRFAAKLLADRAAAPVPLPGHTRAPGAITPH